MEMAVQLKEDARMAVQQGHAGRDGEEQVLRVEMEA